MASSELRKRKSQRIAKSLSSGVTEDKSTLEAYLQNSLEELGASIPKGERGRVFLAVRQR